MNSQQVKKLEEALLDVDGSCRDINFENPTWDGACELLKSVQVLFDNKSAHDSNGKMIGEPYWKSAIKAAQQFDHVLLVTFITP